MLLKPNRSADLTSRKRACAIMTGHVIDEFVLLSLNTYLVIQSRVTCVRIFVEINKAWYRNDGFARNSMEELVSLLIDWKFDRDLRLRCAEWSLGYLQNIEENRGTMYQLYIFLLSFFFFFFFTVMWIRYYGKERKTNQIDNHYRPLILQNWSMNNLFFRDLFKIPQIQFDTWNIVSIVYHWVDTLS